MKPKSIVAVIVLILGVFSFIRLCFADGCFIPPITATRKLPDIPIQRGIISYRDGTEKLIIEAAVDGEGQSFGWIVPIPSVPHRLERVTPGLLKTLSFQLGPEIIHKELKDLGSYFILLFIIFALCTIYVCLGWRGVGNAFAVIILLLFIYAILAPELLTYRAGSGESVQTGVKVISTDIIGSYDTYIIEAKESDDLNGWLEDNGFIPFSEEALPIINETLVPEQLLALMILYFEEQTLKKYFC